MPPMTMTTRPNPAQGASAAPGHCSMVIDLRPGDCLVLGGGLVRIELVQKSGQLARLRVTAPPEVPIKKWPESEKNHAPSMA